MNARIFSEAMSELDNKYIEEALSYNRNFLKKRSLHLAKIPSWIAAAAGLLALCGFAAYELGLFDPWLQKPSADPINTVQSAIEGQIGKEYTLAVQVDEIQIDEEQTDLVRTRYTGSELAKEKGWTEEYLAEHFIVVRASYYVEYDHTKTFLDDGRIEQYFYLTQDSKTGKWMIIENDSPRIKAEP